jgi:hypothetical protein
LIWAIPSGNKDGLADFSKTYFMTTWASPDIKRTQNGRGKNIP